MALAVIPTHLAIFVKPISIHITFRSDKGFTPMDYKPIVTTSLAGQIADAIQQAILDGSLVRNDRLPREEELAVQFGVSRPTVREALKRLAARHLIRSRRGPAGGNFVNGPSPEELSSSFGTAAALLVATGGVGLEDVATARFEMEAVCCRLAAARIEAHEITALREELAQQNDPALSDEEFCASDVRFHRALVRASGNPVLRFMMNVVVETLLPASNMIIARVRDRRIIVAFHTRMTDALEAGAADAAVAALGELIAYTRDQYVKADRMPKTAPKQKSQG